MLLPTLLSLADTTLPAQVPQPAKPAAAPAAKPSLFDVVAQHMSAAGRPIFERYVQQTLIPQARADAAAAAEYHNALQALVAAPTLDVDAVARLMDQRKRTEADHATAIRTAAIAMIKSLPAADRKLALTAIFVDARLPRAKAATPAPAPSAPPRK